METINRPEMKPLKIGDSFKTLSITAKAGMEMPEHHSTLEAVIVVLKGKAILKMPDKIHILSKGKSFIIPKMIPHSLKIEEDFEAIAIMEISSNIEF